MANVIVYSTKTCPYCVMVKDFLTEKGVEFKDVDVTADREAAQAMISKSGQMGVPQVDVGGKMIIGFNREAIEKALRELEESKE